jgi:hypothetical protein
MLTPFLDKSGNLPEGDNIPGVGGIQNVNAMGIGGALTAAGDAYTSLTGGTDKPSGKNVNQAVQNVLNTEMVDEAGKAQTVQEMMRLRKGKGFDIYANDENLLEGLKTIKQAFADKRLNIESGFSPESRDLYLKNRSPNKGGTTDIDEQIRKLEEELGL